MRKSILIGVLAALMLFAFTACENQVPNLPVQGGKDVANITVTSTTVYAGQDYTGETVPAVVSIVYKDGTTTDNVAVKLTVTGNVAKAGSNFGTVAYEGLKESSGKAVNWTVEYQAIAVKDANVVVDEDALKVAYSALSSASTIKGNVSLVYADGYVTPAKKETLSWNAETSTPEKITAVEYTVPATLTGAEEIVKSFDLTITGKTETPVTLSSIAIAYTVNGDAKDTVAANTYFFGDTVTWKVVGTYSDGSKKDLSSSEYYVKDQKTLPSATLTLTDKALDSVTIMAVEDISKTATISIPAGKNYITAITAITPKTQGGPTAGATNVTIASYDVKIATAFDDKGATTFDTSNAVILDPTAPAKGTYAPRFEVKFGKNNAEKAVVTADPVTFPVV